MSRQNETELQARLRRAKEALQEAKEAENEARRALAICEQTRRRMSEKYAELFAEEEAAEVRRRKSEYRHSTF